MSDLKYYEVDIMTEEKREMKEKKKEGLSVTNQCT